MSITIQNEDTLQTCVMKNIHLQLGVAFPRISRIAGDRISPEIDLLYIRQTRDEQTLTGYEFKLLKSKQNDTNYRRIYEGIGQSLLYFQYGIDVSYLLLGISKNVPLGKENSIDEMLYHLTSIMKQGLRCFGVKVWRERQPDSIDLVLEPEGTFSYYSSKECKLCRENLLNSKFVYSKSFLEGLE